MFKLYPKTATIQEPIGSISIEPFTFSVFYPPRRRYTKHDQSAQTKNKSPQPDCSLEQREQFAVAARDYCSAPAWREDPHPSGWHGPRVQAKGRVRWLG